MSGRLLEILVAAGVSVSAFVAIGHGLVKQVDQLRSGCDRYAFRAYKELGDIPENAPYVEVEVSKRPGRSGVSRE